MATPTISLPPKSPPDPSEPLPDLPSELLLSFLQPQQHLHEQVERDALDAFVLSGSSGEGGGGVQVEDVINELIPDEQALSQAPLVTLLLRSKIQEIRMEIQGLTEMLERDQDPGRMSEIQELIGDLLSQVTAIRDAATESEVVVRDITRDIQSLDLAKRNLVASMNALKRFQMLVNAFDQLTRLAKSRRYRETAQALGAVKQLSQFFKTFSSVERVAAVSRGVTEVQGVLKAQVMKDFEEAFSSEAARAGKDTQLTDACLVVDALGDEAKEAFLKWYSLLLLRDYRRIFGSTSEAGQLDNISRRFAWFRRVLKTHEEENSAMFPPGWSVGAVLAGGFSEVTKNDLKAVLAKSSASLGVGLLLESIAQTAEFEREMSRKHSMSFESILALSAIKYGGKDSATPISSVFEPYLGIFVDAQDKTLAEMLQTFTSSRISISPSDNPSAVLSSSTELFYFYREALERCAKLSVRQALLDLCKVYRKWLKTYAEDVLTAALVNRFERRSGEGRPNMHELQTACLVLNTAEYCLETASQLEERLQEKIHPDLRDRVSLEAEKEIFTGTISAALLAILRELELTIEIPFSAMARSPWKELEFVSGESDYVGELTRALVTVVGVVREGIEQKKYVRSTCDKIVGLVLAKFTQTIVRCRPVAQIGAEQVWRSLYWLFKQSRPTQILLDLQSLKNCLMHLVLAPGDSAPIPTSYSRYVSRSVQKIDTLLKVIMTPEDPADEFVKHYLLLVPCQSFSDFQKVLDLKRNSPFLATTNVAEPVFDLQGVRRADQNNLLDLFLASTSTATGLSDTSFLTQLDMDPSSHSLTSPSASSHNSPLASNNLSLFGGFGSAAVSALPLSSAGASRDSSRAGSPAISGRSPVLGGRPAEGGAEKERAFSRFGARLGSRLFGVKEQS
ncbi:SPOSA6832_03023 [Sporobolomyces salmonicolor]|uniref:SPOSA6832_03023-mRNA-1:cds n=1 Tax=Sporidiobolus salmonicolor TaxID=5005 RepID=A0A0D6EMX6_SPOSA|nr:SPOSA6832_03023 [Sporobolomyces salmonicolor]